MKNVRGFVLSGGGGYPVPSMVAMLLSCVGFIHDCLLLMIDNVCFSVESLCGNLAIWKVSSPTQYELYYRFTVHSWIFLSTGYSKLNVCYSGIIGRSES